MKRIVVKLGTGVLAEAHGSALDPGQFQRLAGEFAELIADGHSCIVVSSAAVTAGISVFGLDRRPADLQSKQACASVGQPRLIRAFDSCLQEHGLHAAQLLLTHDDIDSRKRRINARNTLDRLLSTRKVVPIINENDTVAVEELNFGDNDRLSAEVAILADADLLVILTTSDGVRDGDARVPLINDIDAALTLVRPDKGPNSVGGMSAKLDAVHIAITGGVETYIADGRLPGQIRSATERGNVGTRFPVPASHSRKPLH